MKRVNGVYHELKQSVPEVTPRVEDRDACVCARVLASHHAGHGSSGHTGLDEE